MLYSAITQRNIFAFRNFLNRKKNKRRNINNKNGNVGYHITLYHAADIFHKNINL